MRHVNGGDETPIVRLTILSLISPWTDVLVYWNKWSLNWQSRPTFGTGTNHKFQKLCYIDKPPNSNTSIWSIYTYIYTECHRRNGQNFGRVFFMLNYTDITQNTYIQSWTVTEIMAREKCGHLAFPRNVRLQLWSALAVR